MPKDCVGAHFEPLRTRTLLKIQDGCNNFCTYCIIPRARGPEVSYKSEEIIEEAKRKESEGFKEIVLTGINIGSWNEGGLKLEDLLSLLINNTSEVRFRISSIEPENYSDNFTGFLKSGRICPHLHMSLQSGSDSVLKRMRRNYDIRLFQDVCERMRKDIPDIGLTTDVIVGFPGETDFEFQETVDFVKKCGFLKTHVFPYSRRKYTAAYYMSGQIDMEIRKLRAKIMRDISDESAREFVERLTGREYPVLVEQCVDGFCKGYTPNYIPVEFEGGEELINTFVPVTIKKPGVYVRA